MQFRRTIHTIIRRHTGVSLEWCQKRAFVFVLINYSSNLKFRRKSKYPAPHTSLLRPCRLFFLCGNPPPLPPDLVDVIPNLEKNPLPPSQPHLLNILLLLLLLLSSSSFSASPNIHKSPPPSCKPSPFVATCETCERWYCRCSRICNST